MKPLESSRQIFSWFNSDVIDEPLTKYQTMSRQIFRFLLVVISTLFMVALNAPLFINHHTLTDIDEFFFGIFLFDITLYAVSALTATFVWGSKLALLFRSLEYIYNACKTPQNGAISIAFLRTLSFKLKLSNPNSRSG